MFKRDSKHSRIDTLIGAGVRVHGDVEFQGGLHLDGQIMGGVRSGDSAGATLEVSEAASIEGDVRVPNVVLRGAIRGDIHARVRIVLGPTARVEGNVYYGIIEMAMGAQIMGKLVQLAPEGPTAASVTGETG